MLQAGGDDDSVKIGDVGGGAVDTAVYVLLTADTGARVRRVDLACVLLW